MLLPCLHGVGVLVLRADFLVPNPLTLRQFFLLLMVSHHVPICLARGTPLELSDTRSGTLRELGIFFAPKSKRTIVSRMITSVGPAVSSPVL